MGVVIINHSLTLALLYCTPDCQCIAMVLSHFAQSYFAQSNLLTLTPTPNPITLTHWAKWDWAKWEDTVNRVVRRLARWAYTN